MDGSANPNFTVVMRGYERDEVDAYLRDLTAEAKRLGDRVQELESDLDTARARTSDGGGPEEGFRQLGEETTRILVAAETAAREMRQKAERQADAELAAAEKAARERVESASDHADRIVAEAEARQRDVEAEIRRLEGIRAEMVDRLRGAISATEQAIATTPSVDQPRGPATTDTASDPVPSRAKASPFEADDEEDVPVVDPAPGDPGPEDDEATTDEPATLDGSAAPDPVEDVAAADPVPATDDVSADDEVAADTAAASDEVAAAVAEELDGLDQEDDQAPADEPAPVEEPAVDDEPHGGADRSAVEAAMAEADAAVGRAPATADGEEADAEMLRERSLAGVRPGMLRRLRRSLQELQNGVLESVRTRDEDTEVEDLLPTDAEVAGLADVARIFLDAGYRAGRADAPVVTGDESLQDPPTNGTLVGDTADGLAAELLDELRTTLSPSLRAGVDAGEPDASLSERVGEVFRDLKGPVIETVVDRHLTRMYGRATLDGWSEEGVEQVAWVLGEESRCPEGVCRGNEAESPIALGDEFPSGHTVPLAHDGCTCVLRPA